MPDEKRYVDADIVAHDWGISKSKAYKLIQRMNKNLLEKHPDAIVIHGKVSRGYYDQCCIVRADGKGKNEGERK